MTKTSKPMPQRARIDGVLSRDFQIRAEEIDEEKREITFSFSSEAAKVERFDLFGDIWLEILGHREGEVDLTRMNNGAPLLIDHDRSVRSQIGVILKAEIRNGRGVARARISDDPDSDVIFQKIRNGTVTKTSTNYRVREMILAKQSDDGPDEYRVIDWEPYEASLVTIPADDSVGIGRSDAGQEPAYRIVSLTEEDSMSGKKEAGGQPADPGTVEKQEKERQDPPEQKHETARKADNPGSDERADRAERERLIEEGRAAEHKRVSEIEQLFAPFERKYGDGVVKLRQECTGKTTCTVETARERLLAKIGEGIEPAGGDPEIRVGTTAEEKFREGAALALQQRGLFSHARGEQSRERLRPNRSNEFLSMRLERLAEYALEQRGVRTLGIPRYEMIGRAFTESDFPNIIQDVSHQAMLLGFEEAAETWQIWCMPGSLSDFKVAKRSGLSMFGDLVQVVDGGEYTHAGFSDRGEPIQLATYGRLFWITRQTIINDELSAFTEVPMKMGRAASRLVGDLAYGILTSNPTMSDGIALFHASHNNLNEGGAAAFGVTPLSTMRSAMALQTDESGSATGLNIRPGYVLVPVALEDTARQTISAAFDPRTSVNSEIPNPVRNLGDVVPDPRLDADSSTGYYVVAARTFDTVEVAFLDGIQEPRLEQRQGWNVDGTEYKVALDTGAAAREWRTFQHNDGM